MFALCNLSCCCLRKVRSRVSDALLLALHDLSLACLTDFSLSDCNTRIHFIGLSGNLHSAARLDRKTWSQLSHTFRLICTTALHWEHTFVGGILTQLNCLSDLTEKNGRWPRGIHVTWSHPPPLGRAACRLGVRPYEQKNALALQRSSFRENPTFSDLRPQLGM